MKRILFTLLVPVLLLSGCATLFNSGDVPVSIEASPSNVNIVITNSEGAKFFDGNPPVSVSLPRKFSYTVEITLDGYKTEIVPINQNIQGWFWGNLCLGGVVGMVIDGVSGNMWDLSPTSANVSLSMALTDVDGEKAVTLYTRDENGELRYVLVELEKA